MMNSESELEYIDVRRLCLLLAYLQNPQNVTVKGGGYDAKVNFHTLCDDSERSSALRGVKNLTINLEIKQFPAR